MNNERKKSTLLRFGGASACWPPHLGPHIKLATILRNTCRTSLAGPDAPTFEVVTNLTPKQTQALDLIQQITR